MHGEAIIAISNIQIIIGQFSDCCAVRLKSGTIELDVCHRTGQYSSEFAYYRTVKFGWDEFLKLDATELVRRSHDMFKNGAADQRLNTRLIKHIDIMNDPSIPLPATLRDERRKKRD